ncbi:MmgE/PrpD family protein [Micromonospora sp. NPDC005163]
MPADRPLTRELATWLVAASEVPLPAAVEHHARRVLLDYCSAALAGSGSGSARLVRDFLLDTEAGGACRVLGTTARLSPAQAALANGTAAHGLEVDDGYTPGAYHPGAPVISAVLAAAESHANTMEELLTAIAVGFEVSCRLAGAGHPTTWRRGWHSTPVCGVFGAAAGVATLLRLDADQSVHALGLAGSHSGGLFEFLGNGAEVKRLHAGKAARDGLVCAELAARGLTGPATVLEGGAGYAHAFVDDQLDVAHLMDGLGETWRMLRTYVKPYPCCRHLHGPIDAALELAAGTDLDVESVQSIEVGTYSVALKHGFTQVEDFLDAQMSIPYAVAVTLVHGSPTLAHFADDVRSDMRVKRLVEKVVVREDDDCTRDYPRLRPAVFRVATSTRVHEVRVDLPKGEPDRPVDDAELTAKLHALADPVLGEPAVEELARTIWQTEDVQALFRLMGTPVAEPVPA